MANEIDDPFGAKYDTFEDLDARNKVPADPSDKGKPPRGPKGQSMAKAATRPTTPYGMTQSQLSKLSPGQYKQLQAMAAKEGAMRIPPSAMQNLAQGAVRGLGGPGLGNVAKAAARGAGRAFPPAGIALSARDIYKGVQDPDFMTGLIDIFGGEERAYNQWAARQAEGGIEMPSYEDYRARAEDMVQAGELEADAIEERRAALEDTDMPIPDKRKEAARRALAPRTSEELGPDED